MSDIESCARVVCSPVTGSLGAAAGAVAGGAIGAASGALTGMLVVGLARLGQITAEHGGGSFGEPTPFTNTVVPTLVGGGLIFGGIGALLGFFAGVAQACKD